MTDALLAIVRLDSRRGRRAVARLTARSGEVLDRRLVRQVRRLVAAVRRQGDRALLRAVRRFDLPGDPPPDRCSGLGSDLLRSDLAPDLPALHPESVAALRFAVPDPAAEAANLPAGFADALETAIAAVESFHRRQVHRGFTVEEGGVTLSERRQPFRRVAAYVPGGRASYPSTAVMTVVPARVAGVEEVVVVTPPLSWLGSPALRYTLARLGVEEVWGMGGAHAVAALAYGTDSVERVDKIVGPGNAWVTAAKREVAGDVAIDGLAGPTEVLIVADGSADPELLAADLLAQAEHDPRAAALLATPEMRLAKAVRAALAAQVDRLATAATARASLAAFGTAFVIDAMDDAPALVEALAPEHLQLVGAAAEALADRVRSAGAVFVGAATPEVFGDYLAGPSHVLPTGGSARFASALGVEDFVRRSHLVRFSDAAAAEHAAAAAALADAEGLPGHAAAARRRLP